jgi:hypothetical protein
MIYKKKCGFILIALEGRKELRDVKGMFKLKEAQGEKERWVWGK